MVTHELRNPLAVISGTAAVFEDELDELTTEQQRAYLRIIASSSQRLSVMAEDLLDLAQLESGHLAVDPVDTDLCTIITQAVRANTAATLDKQLTVTSVAPQRWDATDLSVLDHYLRTTYPHTYAGLSRTERGVEIFRTGPSPLDEDVRSHARFPVRFRTAAHTRERLEQVAARVVADRDHWESQGVRIALVLVPHDGTQVEVATAQADTAGTALLQRYGDDVLRVTSDEVTPL